MPAQIDGDTHWLPTLRPALTKLAEEHYQLFLEGVRGDDCRAPDVYIFDGVRPYCPVPAQLLRLMQ